ncbi:MAG: bifunctional phosphopantothenoylcysteine decarboxylase/phosphopantothenate--cysteine ligase CoaBC [Magnetococcales bacterium]|nr:bifunctional phosphopantothenoylcysteine decarboxylase/phosphopantothenate--cysteine ligase CoaBC [Magnetococcales bacterium]
MGRGGGVVSLGAFRRSRTLEACDILGCLLPVKVIVGERLLGFWAQRHVVLGIGGGIAAYKALELIRRLRDAEAVVTVVVTAAALEFVTRVTLQTLSGNMVHDALFNLDQERTLDHIRLAKTGDILVVAPATADLLARMAAGMGNDLLSTVFLARRGPVLVAPAMNTAMWEHPATQRNCNTLRADGVHIVGPGSGPLACGDEGPGRLVDVDLLLEAMVRTLTPKPLAGRTILVTAGPTREELDPVRFLSNNSSGKMGWAVANAALRAGAEVILVHGPVAMAPPWGAQAIPVTSAREMEAAARKAWPACQVAILTAAVGDYRPERRVPMKIKKHVGDPALTLTLVQNPDILVGLVAARQPGQMVIGFAAETGPEAIALGREKLVRKQCDWLVVNDVLEHGSGFGVDTNRVTLLTPNGGEECWPLLDKEVVAERLIARVARHLQHDITP